MARPTARPEARLWADEAKGRLAAGSVASRLHLDPVALVVDTAVSALLDEALAHAAKGRPVFPCHSPQGGGCSCGRADCASPGKHPRTAHGFKEATTDPERIRRWWNRWPAANIATPTGGGLVVLDIDPRNGGDDSLFALEQEHGPLPPTFEVATGGGGRHIWFAGDLPSGVLADGIDLKAAGGYVLLPPSAHISGHPYAVEFSAPEELAPLPPWLLNGHRPRTTTREIPEEILDGEGRERYLVSLAGSLRHRGLSEGEILVSLRAVNEARCRPPKPEEDLRRIARSVARYPSQGTIGTVPPPAPAGVTPGHTMPPTLVGLLDAVSGFVRRYVVLTPEQLTAVSLWVAHAHAIEAAETTPYLAISSPLPECGKTRLQETAEPLLPRVLRTANISDAALFRVVADTENGRTAILLDEGDAIFSAKSEREDLRALFNAGYRRGAPVARVEMVGKAGVVRFYDAFGAKAIAGIGQRPETIRSRSIPIVMRRRARNEQVERFRERTVRAEAIPLRDALAAWVAGPGVLDRLADSRPHCPEALSDRQQDAWEPLLAIADEAGGDWPIRARATAVVLHGGHQADEALGELLLMHLRGLFGDRDRMSTVEILRGLIDREDGPWAGWWANEVEAGRTRGPASRLAHLLRPFGVDPRVIRMPDGSTARGYLASDLIDVWARYSPPPDSGRNNATPQVDGSFGGQQGEGPLRLETASDLGSHVVTSEKPQRGAESPSDSGEETLYPDEDDVLAAARAFAWPAVKVAGTQIGATEAAWLAWLRRATPDRRAVAYSVLEAME